MASVTTQHAKQHARDKVRQRRRKNQMGILLGVSVAALLIVALLIIVSLPKQVVATSYDGLAQGLDRSGAAALSLGSSSAPVMLTEYSDFSCPHCYEIVPSIHRLIDEYVRDGKLQILYKPISFVHPPYSTDAAKGAICAAQQQHGWEMQDKVWQLYKQDGPGSYQQGTFLSLAGDLGLDQAKFRACYGSAETAADVESVLTEASALGVNGTPSLFMNGNSVPYTGPDAIYATLKDAIDAALEQAGGILPDWTS